MSQGSEPPYERPNSIFAGFLSYLIPGLGQIYQGRTGKGLLFMVCILSLFHVGEAMGNWENVYVPPTYLETRMALSQGRERQRPTQQESSGQHHQSALALCGPVLDRHRGLARIVAILRRQGPRKAAHPFLHTIKKRRTKAT